MEHLKNILLVTGFNLLEAPLDVYHNFNASGVHVDCVSPLAVLKFFGSYSSDQPMCDLGRLPRAVQATPFEDVNFVVLLLKYCKKDDSFGESLHGLPLLVTQDGTLRVFSGYCPVFLTDHVDVLPQCASEVVHHTLYNRVFHEEDLAKQVVFKAFDVRSLATKLHHILPNSTVFTKNKYVEWRPEKEQEFPNKFWMMQLWKFLTDETKSILQQKDLDASRREVAAKLRPLNDWCLLPAAETRPEKGLRRLETHTRHFLVPIGMADTILTFENENRVPKLRDALRNLSLPELNCKIIDGCEVSIYSKPALMIVANLGCPRRVLRALREKISSSSRKMNAQSEVYHQVLRYFCDHIGQLQEEDKEILRMLPFYLTVDGEHTAMVGRKVYVLPGIIPKEGMSVWQAQTGAVFLKEDTSLSELQDFLGNTSCSEIDFYCNFIFQYFGHMTPKDRLVHLENLRKYRLPVLEKPGKARLLDCLRDLRFIPGEDELLRTASSFYDPRQPVFKEMIQPSLFPPKPFSSWLPFLSQIGMVEEVTANQFLSFAQQVATEARTARNGHTRVKSEALLQHLFQRPNVATEGLLEQIRQIPFVHPCEVSERFTRVYPQFGLVPGSNPPYICFEGAVVRSQESIAWTSATLLPREADPTYLPSYLFDIKYPAKTHLSHTKNYREEITRRLGICEEPTVEHVISHCENVCFHWIKEKNSSYPTKREVLSAIYRFLWGHRSQVAKCRLHNVRCILLENGHLAFPRQIVVEFLGEDEIKPYLFRAPAELGEFHRLFLFLGAPRVVTIEQYAMVLMEIQAVVGSAQLEPNEKRKAFQAVKGIFEALERTTAKDMEVPILYLPGAKKEQPMQVFFRKSTELVFDNAPHLRSRITRFDEMFLVDLHWCELKATNFGSLIEMLPQRFRPRMLTSLVKECLSEGAGESSLQGNALKLRRLLATPHFSRALIRLIRHGDAKEKRKTASEVPASFKQCLSDIQVYGIEGLKTHLLYQGERIPDSEKKKTCFAEEVGERWNVYLETSGDHERTWTFRVAEILNEITGDRLQKDVLMLLLTCTPLDLEPLLDELGILEDHTSNSDGAPHLPQPGTFIHIEDHCLLKDAFEDFEPGEFVGYEPCDPRKELENDSPTLIYAVIIEEVKREGGQTASFQKKYKINVGEDKDPIEVEALDLYKFLREAASASTAPKNLERVMDEISTLLEEAWEKPDEIRDKIIRRLYLAWHPKKNPENEEFCTKAFQYLLSEIARLERGEGRRTHGEVTASGFNTDNYFYGSSGGFSQSFRNWDHRARRQYDRFQGYHWNSGVRPHRANPQPGEARRWFRQAEADLEAASNDLDGGKPSYEWVCFKCHQVMSSLLSCLFVCLFVHFILPT